MRQKNLFHGFTLIELLVWISLISIIALGVTQFNFNRLSQKQQISIETIKIINIFEQARNNSLVWKAVLNGGDLETPASWTISISLSWSGNIESIYTKEDSSTWSHMSWNTPQPFEIQSIECQKLDGTVGVATNPSVIFTGDSWSITGCPDTKYKIISIDYWVWTLTENVSINALSGVIEVN